MSDSAITLLDDYRSGQRCPRRVDGVKKRRWWPRAASSVDTVLVHATAVKGGFGVDANELAAHVAKHHPKAERESGWDASEVYMIARRELLGQRFRRTPYHGWYHRGERMSVVQWPATDVTYHGNAPNTRSLGWAYDGKFTPSEHDELDIEGGRASLRHLIERALEQGCALRQISPHANHAPPPRHAKPHDPGPRVWLEVVIPVVEQLRAERVVTLDIDANWTTGGAEPWAKRWMEATA